MNDHIHYHKLVAHLGRNLYYECACGDREHGISATGRKVTTTDHGWLAGADRPPEELP